MKRPPPTLTRARYSRGCTPRPLGARGEGVAPEAAEPERQTPGRAPRHLRICSKSTSSEAYSTARATGQPAGFQLNSCPASITLTSHENRESEFGKKLMAAFAGTNTHVRKKRNDFGGEYTRRPLSTSSRP
jgi:hypothetical protein